MGSRGLALVWLGMGIGAVACGDPRRDEDASGGQQPTGLSDSSGADDGTVPTDSGVPGSGTAVDDDGSEGGGTKLDVGPDPTLDGAGDAGDGMGCDKVDFLFVIDNSGSMGDEQGNLKASFPGFIDTISTQLDVEQDFHILVTDVDAYVYEQCDIACGCSNAMGMCDAAVAPECGFACLSAALPCGLDPNFTCGTTVPMACEDVLGAGVTFPRGQGATNQDCNFASGARYMDASEPDLTAAFNCAAGVGVGSTASTERPMQAMVNAVSPNTDAAACNAGWIRDDAILVVTFITDENDGTGDSGGTVAGWRQALIAAKGGDENAVVVLGLFGDNDLPGAICADLVDSDGAEAAPRLREFIDSWGDHGFFGSVCASNFDDFFTEAVGIIDTTCEEFVPPEG